MTGINIGNGFLDFAIIDFACPHCSEKYTDSDGKYLDRCNKNQNWCTRVSCKCGQKFLMTYDGFGNAVGFKK